MGTSGDARIADFGLAMVTQDLDLLWSGSDECGDSARWIAPEILNGWRTYSKEADAISFVMVAIEVRPVELAQRRSPDKNSTILREFVVKRVK